MRTYYTNYTHAKQIKDANGAHETLKSANAEKREFNKIYGDTVPQIVARLVAPNQYGEDTFIGYYVCNGDDMHLV